MSVWVKQSARELQQAVWLLGGALGMIALWASLSLTAGSPALTYGVLFLIFVSLLRPQGLPCMPRGFWVWVTRFVFGFALVDFIWAGAGFLSPLLRLVVLILFIRICTFRTRREEFQLLLLSMFLLVMAGVLTVSLLFAFQILLFTPLAMTYLFLVNLAESSKDRLLTREDWAGFSWLRYLRWMRGPERATYFAFGAFWVIILFIIAGLTFVLIPRFQFDQAIPFLQNQARAQSGFTENIRFGDVTSIAQDNRVAVRIDPPSREAVPPLPYWRMLVVDRYFGGLFSASPSLQDQPFVVSEREPNAEFFPQFVGLDRDNPGRIVAGSWTFYMEGNISRYLPHLGPYLRVRFPRLEKLFVNEGGSFYRIERVSPNVFSYQIESMYLGETLAAHPLEREAFVDPEAIVVLPKDLEEGRVAFPMTQLAVPLFPVDLEVLGEFIDEIRTRDGVLSPDLVGMAFVEAAVSWLRSRHVYSLSPRFNASTGDPLIRWMESQSGGHCELFAGSLALLCRGAGIPARLVVGFSGGSWNPVENYFIIRNRNAHAWVEVYVDGLWRRVDPTPGASNPSLGTGGDSVFEGIGIVGLEAGWGARLDSLRIAWYRRVVNFDGAAQEALAAVVADVGKELMEGFKNTVRVWMLALVDGWTRIWASHVWVRMFMPLAALSLLILLLFRGRLSTFLRLRRLGRWMRGGQDRYRWVRRQAGGFLRRIHITPVGPDDPPGRDSLIDALEQLRFGEQPDAAGADRVFRATRQWLRRARRLGRRSVPAGVAEVSRPGV